MADTKSKAAQLADALDAWDGKLMMPKGWRESAAAELRRLDVIQVKLLGWVNDAEQKAGTLQRRLNAVEAERDALLAEVERLRAAPAPVAHPAGEPVEWAIKDFGVEVYLDGIEAQYSIEDDEGRIVAYVFEMEDARRIIAAVDAVPAPVAWMGTDALGNPNKFRLNEFSGAIPLYSAAAPAPVAQGEPVAWLYTLEYGETVADKKVSLSQLNYPFGVCGADYLRSNDDGMSYVRQTPIYTAAPAPVLTPAQAHADELLAAMRSAITCSYADHGRRSVNKQSWDRLVQAVAMVVHGIKATGQEGDAA